MALVQTSLRNGAPLAMASKRFYTVGENNKTSVLVETEDGPGTLYGCSGRGVFVFPWLTFVLCSNCHAGSLQEILKFFWKHDVNMTRIESRPSKGHNQNYSFYIDFDGKRGDVAVDDLMDDLKKNSLVLMVLHDKKGTCVCAFVE